MLRTVTTQFALGARSELRHSGPITSASIHFALTLVIFYGLWVTSAQSGLGLPASPTDMVWYLVVTEVITFSTPHAHREVAREINAGRVVAHMLRPINFLVALIARYIGVLTIRFVFLTIVGCSLSYLITGALPTHSAALGSALIVAPLASSVLLLFLTAIGLSAAWLRDPLPLYWIFSKATMVFGGIMVPLSIYPEWFQRIAAVLPFQAILYGIAGAVIHPDGALGFLAIAQLIAWGCVAFGIAALLHYAYVRRILREGE
jgi:ABC-2 type transport system permease protein